MPLTYHVYADARLLFIRGVGAITQRDRVEAMNAWLADPAYQTCLDALCDFSAAESVPRLAELRELIAVLEHRLPPMGPRRLAVVTARPIAFAVARIFQDLMQIESAPLQVRVFFDRNHAWTWLRPRENQSRRSE